MEITTGYVVYDVFNEPLRTFTIDQKEAMLRFTSNKDDCRIEEITLNLYELLGEGLL